MRQWPEAFLLLAYWAMRLHNLTAYPAFDDESMHIRWSKMVWKLLPFAGADDGRVLNILLYAQFWPFGPGALWISRAAYLLVGAVGFAAILATGRALFGRRAGMWAGVAFIVMPFAFFFERIALADTLGIPFVALTALLSLRATRRNDRLIVLAGGISLAGLILSKLTNLVFLFVPALAVLFHGRIDGQLMRRWPWQAQVRRMATMYMIASIALAPILLFLVFRAHSTLGFANVAVRTGAAPFAERLARQMASLSEYPGAYLTWPIVLLCLLALGLGLWHHSPGVLYTFALTAVPVAASAVVANSIESRYLAPVAPGLALLTGCSAAWMTERLRLPRLAASALLFVVLGLGGAFEFIWAGWNTPERLALPAADIPDYIEGWPSGFGVEAAEQYILQRAASEPVSVVVTEGWHMAGLTVHYGWERNLHGMYAFSEDQLQIAWLQSGCDPFVLLDGLRQTTLLVADRLRHAATIDCLLAEKTLVASFPKPDGHDFLDVYEIRPLP